MQTLATVSSFFVFTRNQEVLDTQSPPDVPDTYFWICLFIPVILLELSKGENMYFDSYYPSIFHQKWAGRQHASGGKKRNPEIGTGRLQCQPCLCPLPACAWASHAASGGPSSFLQKGQNDTNLSGWPSTLKNVP